MRELRGDADAWRSGPRGHGAFVVGDVQGGLYLFENLLGVIIW